VANRDTASTNNARLVAFGKLLEKLSLEKGWTAADLAREMQKHAPEGTLIGRHLPSAYMRGANEPTQKNLLYISKVFGMKPEELLPPALAEGECPNFAQATSTLDGRTRIVVDAEVDAETRIKILELVREGLLSPTLKATS